MAPPMTQGIIWPVLRAAWAGSKASYCPQIQKAEAKSKMSNKKDVLTVPGMVILSVVGLKPPKVLSFRAGFPVLNVELRVAIIYISSLIISITSELKYI
jgi:hypothetical protein